MEDTTNQSTINTTLPTIMSDKDLIRSSFYFAIVMIVICFFGIFGNLMSIIIYSRKHMRKISINILLIGLSTTDLLMLCLAPPAFAISPIAAYLDKWSNSIDDFLDLVTVTIYPLVLTLQTSSVWICTLISAERYLAVCYPLKVRFHCTTTRSKVALACIYLSSFCYNLIGYWEYSVRFTTANDTLYSGERDTSMLISGPNLAANEKFKLWYKAVAYSITHLTPIALLTFLNFCVVLSMLRARKQRRKLTSMETSEHKTTQMMMLVIFIFVFCYSLNFSMPIYELLKPSTDPVSYLLIDINNTLVVLNSASTYIVYLIFSQKYRKAAITILSGKMNFDITSRLTSRTGSFADISATCNSHKRHSAADVFAHDGNLHRFIDNTLLRTKTMPSKSKDKSNYRQSLPITDQNEQTHLLRRARESVSKGFRTNDGTPSALKRKIPSLPSSDVSKQSTSLSTAPTTVANIVVSTADYDMKGPESYL